MHEAIGTDGLYENRTTWRALKKFQGRENDDILSMVFATLSITIVRELGIETSKLLAQNWSPWRMQHVCRIKVWSTLTLAKLNQQGGFKNCYKSWTATQRVGSSRTKWKKLERGSFRWPTFIRGECRRRDGLYGACLFRTTSSWIEGGYVQCPGRDEVRSHGFWCVPSDLLRANEAVAGALLEGNVGLVLTDAPYNVRSEQIMDNALHDFFTPEYMSDFVKLVHNVMTTGHANIFPGRGCSFPNCLNR